MPWKFRIVASLCWAVFLLGSWQRAEGQAYGLAQRPVAAAFLNNTLPALEASTTGWSSQDAFPALSFDDPTFIVPLPNTNRLLVGNQKGVIYSFVDSASTTTKSLFLDLSAVTQGNVGSGMMGFVFHPKYGVANSPDRNYIYVFYSYSPSPNYDPAAPSESVGSYNRVSRFTVPDGSLTADRNSELILINQFDRHLWHCGGAMVFGADGFLYLSCGDEGGNNDPYNHGGKNNEGLFSGVLRMDVDKNPSRSHPIRRQPQNSTAPPAGWPASYTQNYYIPNDNPWLDAGGAVLEEFYAVGFRNPHRMTYDAQTNRIWLGDVGQSSREEVNVVEKGGNYQWGYMEGTVAGAHAKPNPILGVDTPPVFEYSHDNGYTAVIGGYVYRGTQFAAYLEGKYLFGDNGTARIRALTYDGNSAPQVFELCTIPHGGGETTGMSTFGLDANNEILMCCAGPGVKIYKLAKANTGGNPPALLSQTGAFTSLVNLTPSPSLIPYSTNAPLWSDNAVKARWMSVPNDGAPYTVGETVDFSDTGAWNFPIGTVFVKHFELPINDTNPALRKRLETRFLVHASDGSYYGLTYKWRADNTDADLLPAGLSESNTITTATGTRTQTWSYPSRQECMVCHNNNAGNVLGARTCQLNGNFSYPATGVADNQLRALSHIGLFKTPPIETNIPTLPQSASIKDNTASAELRVRSYLDSNCSHCHRPGGVKANFDARLETPLAFQGLIRGDVTSGELGIINPKIITPGDPSKSMLHHRDNLLGANQMPPLARNMIDTDYIDVLTQWINSIPLDYSLPAFIGNKSEGNNGTDFITDATGSFINANRFTATNAGTLLEIHAKVGAITGSYKCAIYSDANGVASSLLAESATLTNVAAGWQTFPLTTALPITGSGSYWIGIWSNDQNARVHMDTGGSLSFAPYPFGAWPTTVNLTGTSTVTYCIYATGPSQDTSSPGVFTNQTPASTGADSDYELGMKFRVSQPGAITAIRYYRPNAETGNHTGRLWSAAGTLLATATFTGESTSGWQQATLTNPVTLAANTTYVVSVNSNTAYPYTDQGLANAITNGSLTTIADGANGVFNDTPNLFPNLTFHNANYFRDVAFTPFNAFQQWKITSGLSYNAPAASDTDGDGINLFLEYALGSSPTTSSPTAQPTYDGTAITFFRARADLIYTVEISDNLSNWTPIAINPGSIGQLVTVAAHNNSPRLMVRLRVNAP